MTLMTSINNSTALKVRRNIGYMMRIQELRNFHYHMVYS